MKKVYFTQRLLAYLIDYVIVSIVLILCVSLLGLVIPSNSKEDEAYDSFSNAYTNLLENPGERNLEEFYKEQTENMYIIEKGSVPSLLFGIIINIGYFGAFQFLNNGQTIGKKAVRIKVVGNNNKKYTYLSSAIRAALTYSSFTNAIICIIFLFMKQNNYLIPYSIVSFSAFTFNLITLLFIVIRKDGRGLPDLICNTVVDKA